MHEGEQAIILKLPQDVQTTQHFKITLEPLPLESEPVKAEETPPNKQQSGWFFWD
ncbi:hypothetical protein [Teredinibacter sp. KSP-S5-2]|uniref:hypothetical protein n=1 Tax=Teredinibacter sp. KSP-S5-2 TaxID=3034506 RepID=UPI002934B398|nr:hypothetical protein [Teredinibacter sp. KSP-S5-2]WNO11241.1 hypothetical protein P5V12_08650 [Teredinibacter sp. KSP-S5-2]